MPEPWELRRWFCNPNTGVGTLGGHGGIDWIDIDSKCFNTQEECDAAAMAVIDAANAQNGWIERTGSHGWRIAIVPAEKPSFTNFARSQGGHHIGEALYKGRFTVLAPSVHPNGNRYKRVNDGMPTKVPSLAACGIFPALDEVQAKARAEQRQQRKLTDLSYGVPSSPNGLDIREFARFFDGYEERRNGWGYAKCPHHNGSSPTSFRVHLGTGQFKLWCGCGTTDVWRSGLELAKSRGFVAPVADRVSLGTPIADSLDKADRDLWQAEELREQAEIQGLCDSVEVRNSETFGAVELPAPGSVLLLDGGLGSGKTESMKGIVQEFFRQHPEGIADLPGHRNLLGKQTADRLGLEHLHELKRRSPQSVKGLAYCLDSIGRRYNTIIEACKSGRPVLVCLDEITELLKHLLDPNGGTLGPKQSQVYAMFVQMLRAVARSGGYIVAAQAGIPRLVFEWLETEIGAPIHLIRNDLQRYHWDVSFPVPEGRDRTGETSKELTRETRKAEARIRRLEATIARLEGKVGAKPEQLENKRQDLAEAVIRLEEVKARDDFETAEIDLPDLAGWTELREQVAAGKRVYVYSDSQTFLEMAEERLSQEFVADRAGSLGLEMGQRSLRIVRIDSKTTDPDCLDAERNRAILSDPHKLLGEIRPDVLLLSPSGECGVDLPGEYFDLVVGLNLHCDSDKFLQGLGRVRSNCPRILFSKKSAIAGDKRLLDGAAIRKHRGISVRRSVQLSGAGEGFELRRGREFEARFNYFSSEFEARSNRQKVVLRETNAQSLRRAGHNVTIAPGRVFTDQEIRNWGHEKREFRRRATIQPLAKAEPCSEHEAKEIEADLQSKLSDRLRAKKFRLNERYPGMPQYWDDEEFLERNYFRGRGLPLRTHELLWLTQYPQIAQQLDIRGLSNQLEKPFVVRSRVGTRYESALLLRQLQEPLERVLSLTDYQEDTPEVQALAGLLKAHSGDFWRLLKLRFREEHTNIQRVNKLARRLGYVSKSRRKRCEGGLIRLWTLVIDEDTMSDRAVIHQSLSQRFAEALESLKGRETEQQAQTDPRFLEVKESLQNRGSEGETDPWKTPESIADIRDWLIHAQGDPQMQAEIRRMAPSLAIELALTA